MPDEPEIEIEPSDGRVVVYLPEEWKGVAHLTPAAALDLAARLKSAALEQLRAAEGPCGLCADQGVRHGCEACGLKRLGLLGVDGKPYYAVFQSRKKSGRAEVDL